MAQRPLAKRAWYEFLRVVFRLLGTIFFRIRAFGREHVPAHGGVLIVSNHQSHLDPILLGLAFDRRMNFVARESLFVFTPFRWLINSLDAIPLDREGIGLAGLKESLRRLKDQEMLLIFPEGTRTSDGQVGLLKPGFLALARRAKVPLLPVALEGAFQAMPRHSRFPWPGAIQVHIGQTIEPSQIARLTDDELLAEVDRRIRDCHLQAKASLRRGLGLHPPYVARLELFDEGSEDAA